MKVKLMSGRRMTICSFFCVSSLGKQVDVISWMLWIIKVRYFLLFCRRAVKRAVSVAVSVSVICFCCRDASRQIYIAVGHFRDTLIAKCRESSRHMQSMSRIISTYLNGVGD